MTTEVASKLKRLSVTIQKHADRPVPEQLRIRGPRTTFDVLSSTNLLVIRAIHITWVRPITCNSQ